MTAKQFFDTKQSLARQALLRMALRIALVIVIATGVSYWHVYSTLRSSVFMNLTNYVDLRSKAESEQFLLAERQSAMVRDEFLHRLQEMGDRDPKAEFDRIFVRESDGLIRVRPEINDHRRHATVYLRHDVPITPDLRRRVYLGWQLLDQWGPMLVNRFFSGFMNMPEQLSINFCPSADWGRSATRETDITTYETYWRATIGKNPERLPFWTAVYYDPGAKAWMLSRVTPGDYKGRWVVTGGQDVEVADLIRRTVSNHVEQGTWNFIVDAQSNLIAHPNLTDQIEKSGGNLQVSTLGDAELAAMVRAVLDSDKNIASTIEPSGLDVFLGVSRIKGPEWFFVTVYPRKLLTALAFSTARIIFSIGFASLLLELIIMAIILRRRVAGPIAQTVIATERISRGDYTVRLDDRRNDELGLLAASVNRMAETIGERDAELMRQYRELQDARNIQQEQQRLESIGTLAGGIAHDFNNILGAIIGYTQFALMRGKDDERWKTDLQNVLAASDRASALVRQILTFSRKQLQEKVPLQLSLIVKETVKLLRASIPSTIEIQEEITSAATILADMTQIHQVIMNLCTNAYQSMEQGQGGVLSITLKDIDSGQAGMADDYHLPQGRYAMLTVSDTGCGMDRETMLKIFDPYFTTKAQGRGTGLGLAVTRGIVESHNGLITVKSEPGQGTTFTVYLPIIQEQAATETTETVKPVPVLIGYGRVMVVDDERSLRELTCRFLTDAGYDAAAFANGFEAWQALSQSPGDWDLLLTDQTMPEMTGDQLAIRALGIRPDLPVILCSGFSSNLEVDQLKKAGVAAFLEKPIDRDMLLTQVAMALKAKETG